jgi:hypothetical protein
VLGKVYTSQTIVLGTGCDHLQFRKDSSIPAGIYFVVVTNGSSMLSQRLVVQ